MHLPAGSSWEKKSQVLRIARSAGLPKGEPRSRPAKLCSPTGVCVCICVWEREGEREKDIVGLFRERQYFPSGSRRNWSCVLRGGEPFSAREWKGCAKTHLCAAMIVYHDPDFTKGPEPTSWLSQQSQPHPVRVHRTNTEKSKKKSLRSLVWLKNFAFR